MTDPKLFEAPPEGEKGPWDAYAIDRDKLVHYRVDAITRGDYAKVLALHVSQRYPDGRWYRFQTGPGWLYATPADAWAAHARDLQGSIENAIEAIGKLEANLVSYREQCDRANSEVLRLLGALKGKELLGDD